MTDDMDHGRIPLPTLPPPLHHITYLLYLDAQLRCCACRLCCVVWTGSYPARRRTLDVAVRLRRCAVTVIPTTTWFPAATLFCLVYTCRWWGPFSGFVTVHDRLDSLHLTWRTPPHKTPGRIWYRDVYYCRSTGLRQAVGVHCTQERTMASWT